MPLLNNVQRHHLRRLAHPLKPFVQIAKSGLTDWARASVDQVLEAYELVKIKFVAPKEEKDRLIAALARLRRSEVVGVIGYTAILYRRLATSGRAHGGVEVWRTSARRLDRTRHVQLSQLESQLSIIFPRSG